MAGEEEDSQSKFLTSNEFNSNVKLDKCAQILSLLTNGKIIHLGNLPKSNKIVCSISHSHVLKKQISDFPPFLFDRKPLNSEKSLNFFALLE